MSVKRRSYDYVEEYNIENQNFWLKAEYDIRIMAHRLCFMRQPDRLIVSYVLPEGDQPTQWEVDVVAQVAAGAFIMHDIAVQRKKDQEEEDAEEE